MEILEHEMRMERSEFTYTIYIRTTADRLWQALTQPEHTKRYWVESWHDSTWQVGATWQLMIPDGRVGDSGEILEVLPPRRLVFTWRNEFQPDLRKEGHSRVSWELEPVGSCVKLTVTQVMERADSKLIQGVAGGWPMILSSLKSLLETGEPLEETRKWPEGL
jgi:uncharacterized protein YndB with AHSA1/START domain